MPSPRSVYNSSFPSHEDDVLGVKTPKNLTLNPNLNPSVIRRDSQSKRAKLTEI